MIKNNFTVKDAIKIQEVDLFRWKTILRDDIYIKLEKYAGSENKKAVDGYMVRRGDDLMQFVLSISYGRV